MELRAIVNNTAELFVPTATALITLARATAEILGSGGSIVVLVKATGKTVVVHLFLIKQGPSALT